MAGPAHRRGVAGAHRDPIPVLPYDVGGWAITDLGSTNGVKVNGRPVHDAYPVTPGDHIEVGTVDVRFEVL